MLQHDLVMQQGDLLPYCLILTQHTTVMLLFAAVSTLAETKTAELSAKANASVSCAERAQDLVTTCWF